ncbi:asparagine-rich protein-like [Calliphora vicina]|uniref:asparagine-rich protein-like n=1 Tax=Calliphora vicina TaxID=7373 RepID=UPI00325B6356
MFIKMFKLLAICVLCFNVYTLARSVSISQVGDVIIEKSDDKWKCDKIECPPDTDRCFVSKSNKEEPSILKRVNYCYSRDNQILKQYVNETPVDPTTKINMQITTTRHGNNIGGSIGNSGTLEDFDEEKFNHEMNQMQANINSQMANMDKEMENQMQHLHSNLQNMNENINKNLQNQMDNLHENLAQMQYNLDHMFD